MLGKVKWALAMLCRLRIYALWCGIAVWCPVLLGQVRIGSDWLCKVRIGHLRLGMEFRAIVRPSASGWGTLEWCLVFLSILG